MRMLGVQTAGDAERLAVGLSDMCDSSSSLERSHPHALRHAAPQVLEGGAATREQVPCDAACNCMSCFTPMKRCFHACSHPHTLRYAAPEVLEGGAVNDRSDVYAFGMLLYEIFSGNVRARFPHASCFLRIRIVGSLPSPDMKIRHAHLHNSPARAVILHARTEVIQLTAAP